MMLQNYLLPQPEHVIDSEWVLTNAIVSMLWGV